MRCRLLSFCYHILLEMPSDYSDDGKCVLERYVKKNRLKVLMDMEARKKARAAALLSFLGMGTLRKVLKKINKRKKD